MAIYPHILVAEGGGMRNVFAAGVLDRFLAQGFDPFDLCMGVSSGAGNLAAFMAGMPGRNLLIYTSYFLDPEFISVRKFLRGGHLMDLDWMWEKTIADVRLDLKTIYSRGRPFLVCLTDVDTGQAVYKPTRAGNLEAVLKASSALPVIYRGFPRIDGRPYTDGGISDPLPVKTALALGGKKIMVIRSRPAAYMKKEAMTQALLRLAFAKYPALAGAAASRVDRYNAAVKTIQYPPKGVDIIQVSPPDGLDLGRLSRNRGRILSTYLLGKAAGDKAILDWQQGEDK